MTEAVAKELYDLRMQAESLRNKANAIQRDLDKITARMIALKWAEYPIGSRALDSKGIEYEVGG